MNEIIKIKQLEINGAEVNSVNARDIWEYLEVKREFTTWIKTRLDELGAIENVDYIVFDKNVKNLKGGRPSKKYIVTLDIAKHLAMMERNEKGKEVRRYFIEVEKRINQLKPVNVQDPLLATMNVVTSMRQEQLKLESEVREVKSELTSLKDETTFTSNDAYRYHKAVKAIVEDIISKYPSNSKSSLYGQIHGRIKEHYKVGSYKDLPHYKIDEVLALLKNLPLNIKIERQSA